MVHDRGPACRFAHHTDALGVASKKMDVLLHPFECQTLIQETSIRGAVTGLKSRPAQPTEGTKLDDQYGDDIRRTLTYSVVDCDINHAFVTPLKQSSTATPVVLASKSEATAKNPDHHRSPG